MMKGHTERLVAGGDAACRLGGTSGKGVALVACPTYAGKQYALDDWLAAYHALTHPDRYAYQVDNTRLGTGYFDLLRSKGIDCTHVVPWPDWDRTFKRCWELILDRAVALNCYWVYSVEADNIPAPESLEVMINLALYGKLHLVTHAYPMHATAAQASGLDLASWYYHELGCMLMSRSLLTKALADFEEYGNIAASIFRSEARYHGGWCKLTNTFKVGHLDGYRQSFANLGPSDLPGLIMPTPRMPKDYGTQLPECVKGEGQ